MNNICLFNAQGGFLCNRKITESFVQSPHEDARYNIHVLVTMGNSIIYDRRFDNISPLEGNNIATITSQWDKSNITPVDVRITDNTLYKPNMRVLELLIEYNNNVIRAPFTNKQIKTTKNTVMANIMKRTIEFEIPYFSSMNVSFDTKNMSSYK